MSAAHPGGTPGNPRTSSSRILSPRSGNDPGTAPPFDILFSSAPELLSIARPKNFTVLRADTSSTTASLRKALSTTRPLESFDRALFTCCIPLVDVISPMPLDELYSIVLLGDPLLRKLCADYARTDPSMAAKLRASGERDALLAYEPFEAIKSKVQAVLAALSARICTIYDVEALRRGQEAAVEPYRDITREATAAEGDLERARAAFVEYARVKAESSGTPTPEELVTFEKEACDKIREKYPTMFGKKEPALISGLNFEKLEKLIAGTNADA
eukprot:CAMPEP_0119410184 /NCGR_PEP_ID=MMETSP1335-20130426/3274_1 /TAXON_ID=259385 /ORGANISM="Chrysoculter rhomboideus, Strain RCC1486" /LENGTH=272 /DNA_ID=CAMNT_0007434669 /DNA_START=280 /DNA_END=1098 /DNA_ORIENTATION=-